MEIVSENATNVCIEIRNSTINEATFETITEPIIDNRIIFAKRMLSKGRIRTTGTVYLFTLVFPGKSEQPGGVRNGISLPIPKVSF